MIDMPGTPMTTNESTTNNEYRLGKDGHKSVQDASIEQALIAAAQAGISDAMDELLVRHRRCLYRAARRFTQTHEEAEDLVQDAMLRAFVNVGKFRHESHFATWLIAIVNNAGLSMKRKGKGVYWLSLDSRKDEFERPERLGRSRWPPQSRTGDHAEGTARNLAGSTSTAIADAPDHPGTVRLQRSPNWRSSFVSRSHHRFSKIESLPCPTPGVRLIPQTRDCQETQSPKPRGALIEAPQE